MAKITDKLSSLIKDKVLLKEKEESVLQDNVKINLRIISENSLSFVTMARDLNVARQNVQKLVKIMGGEAKTGADDQYKTEEQRRKLTETRKEEIKAEELKKKKPTPVKEEKKKPSLFSKFKSTKIGKKIGDIKKAFSVKSIIDSLLKFLPLAGIIAIIYDSLKETLSEWIDNLWGAIKEKFDEWIKDIKKWFEEIVQPIVDSVKDFIKEMIEKVGKFFESIGNWFIEKFEVVKEGFDKVVTFVKNIWNKFMGIIDDFKDILRPKVAAAMKVPGVSSIIPDFLLKWLDLKKEEPKIPPKSAEESREEAKRTTEKAKSDRERSDEAAQRAADTKGAERAQAEKEEREAADRARQSELEARNKRRQARSAENIEKQQEPESKIPVNRRTKEKPAETKPPSAEEVPATTKPTPTEKEPTTSREEKPKSVEPIGSGVKTQPTETPSPKKQPSGAPGVKEEEPPSPKKATKAPEKPGVEVAPKTPTQETKEKPSSAPSRKPTASGGDVATSGGLKGLNFAERAQVVAEGLKKEGITNNTVIKAILSVAAKESQIGGAAKESGGKAYKNTFYNYESGKGGIPTDKYDNVVKDAKAKRPGEPAPQSGPGAGVAYMNFSFGKNWSKDKWMSVFEEEDFFKAVGYGGGEKYLGRGLIGITHDFTFNFLGKFLGVDLLGNPDLITDDRDIMIKSTAAYLALLAGGATIPPVGTWPKSYTPEKLQELYKKGLEKLNSGEDYKEATGYVAVLVGAPGRAKTKESTEAALAGSYSGQQQKSAMKFEGKITEALSEKPTQTAQGAPVMTGAGVPLTSGATGKPVTSGYPTEAPKPRQAPKTEAPTPKKGDENKVERDAIKSSSTVEAAAKMIGLNENEHKEQLQEFLNKYSGTPWLPIDTDAGAWCAKFANAILRSIGFPGSGNNLALSFLKYGGVVFDKEKRIGDITAAKPGDLMMQSRGGGRGHVAFIESISGSNAIVVGGNQKGKPGENHSGGVTRMPAPLKSIVAIRRPGMPYTEEAIVPTNEEANKIAYGSDAGGPSLHAEGTPKKTPTGSDVGRTSTDIAAQQRQQQKPSTPIVVNAPVTNNNTTVQNAPPAPAQQKDTAGRLVQRAA